MRIKLTLVSSRVPFCLPFNYQPLLQAAVYNMISKTDKAYASRLHNQGYWRLEDGKHYKLFVFSDLLLGKRRPEKGYLKVYNNECQWVISSPMNEFLQNIVNGFFSQGFINLDGQRFMLKNMETLPLPEFSDNMKFTALAPIHLSTRLEENGRLREHYILPEEQDLAERVMHENLKNKYKRIYNKEPETGAFSFQFDLDYIGRKGIRRVSRLITIHQGRNDETRIRGFMAPFTVRGNPELIKVGYEAGFGGRNSLGFGMGEVVRAGG